MKFVDEFLDEFRKEIESLNPLESILVCEKLRDELDLLISKVGRVEDRIITINNTKYLMVKPGSGHSNQSYSAKLMPSKLQICSNLKRKRNYNNFYFEEQIETPSVTHFYKSLVVRDNIIGDVYKNPAMATRSK